MLRAQQPVLPASGVLARSAPARLHSAGPDVPDDRHDGDEYQITEVPVPMDATGAGRPAGPEVVAYRQALAKGVAIRITGLTQERHMMLSARFKSAANYRGYNAHYQKQGPDTWVYWATK